MCNMHFSYFCLSLMFISLFCVCLFYGLVPELNVLMMMMMMITLKYSFVRCRYELDADDMQPNCSFFLRHKPTNLTALIATKLHAVVSLSSDILVFE